MIITEGDKKFNRKYVYVEELDGGAMFCGGIFDTLEEALGRAMIDIWDFKNNYKDEGDIFEISDLYEMDGEGGKAICVEYKAACWEKSCKSYYFFLYYDTEFVKRSISYDLEFL